MPGLSLCRPLCTQFSPDSERVFLLNHLKNMCPFIMPHVQHVHAFSCIFHINMLTVRLNKQDRSLLCIRAAPRGVTENWSLTQHGCRPRLPSTARGFWCLAILGLAQGDARNYRKSDGKSDGNSHPELPNFGLVESVESSIVFAMKDIEASPTANQQILFLWTSQDWPCIQKFGGTGSDTSTWSYCSRCTLDTWYILINGMPWMQFQDIPSIQWHPCSCAT